MEKFRLMTRDTLSELCGTYDGSEPTEEQKAVFPNKLANITTYMILRGDMQKLERDKRGMMIQMTEEHPEIFDIIKGTLLRSPDFQRKVEEILNQQKAVKDQPQSGKELQKPKTEVKGEVPTEIKQDIPQIGGLGGN